MIKSEGDKNKITCRRGEQHEMAVTFDHNILSTPSLFLEYCFQFKILLEIKSYDLDPPKTKDI